MSISHDETQLIVADSKGESPFMRLPTEVREIIYEYLLIAKHVAKEHNMNSKEFDENRDRLLEGPDQTYVFHTAIMGTNRRIHEESVDLCRRKNNFVCLTSRKPSLLGLKLEDLGLQILAKGPKAHGFWNRSMTITVDTVNFDDNPNLFFANYSSCTHASKGEGPWNYIFSNDELPTFCRLLLNLSAFTDDSFRDTILYIEINPAISNGQATEIDSTPAGLSRMQQLLEPLRQLHGFGAAHIEGPLSGSYKGSINASVCGNCPTAWDILQISMRYCSQGDQDLSEGRLLQANKMYKSALNRVRCCCWRYDERDLSMNNEPFPGLTAEQSIANLKVRLQARIASVYLKSGMMRMARIYTERALDPQRPYERGFRVYTLDIEPWQGVVYAEVLHAAAQIRYMQGNVWEAKEHLWDAGQLVPFNDEQQSTHDAWQAQADVLHQKNKDREQARKLRFKKQNKKTEALLLVVANWKKKGDRLLRRGASDLAASTYKAALSKLYSLEQRQYRWFKIKSGPFEDYCAANAINALRFKLQASVAASYLMSRCYDDVMLWTDAALECSHEYHDCRYSCERNSKWREDQRLDYLRLHQCRALALKRTGDLVGAVENMEKAVTFDPGDGNVFAQLTQLKRLLEEERQREEERQLKEDRQLEKDEVRRSIAIRRNWARKVNARQDQLRKKQAARRIKARSQKV